MNGLNTKGPIISCTILGVVCASYIAYYFYKRTKKNSQSERPKKAHKNKVQKYTREDRAETEDSYRVVDASDYSDYYVIEPSNKSHKSNTPFERARTPDRRSRADDLRSLYIEDVGKGPRKDKVYNLLGVSQLMKSTSSSTISTRNPRGPRSVKESRRKQREEEDPWIVLDDYSNVDGSAEELNFAENTVGAYISLITQINPSLEQVVGQEDKPLLLAHSNSSNLCSNLSTNMGSADDSVECSASSDECRDCGCKSCSVEPLEAYASDGSEIVLNGTKRSINGSEQHLDAVPPLKPSVNGTGGHSEVDEETGSLPNPESVKIYLKNFGCSHNISDSEYMLGLLDEYGFAISNKMEESDIAIVNSCTVKGPSEEGMVSFIRAARALNLPVIVSGCVPQADKKNAAFNDPHISLLGITQIDRIVEVVENALMGRKTVLLEKKELPQLDLPKVRKNKLIEIIPLSTGCLGSCTFCKTKHSRGVLGSYDIEVILDRVERCVSEGVKEIWLTSEDLGAYGIDLGTDIVTLLNSVVALLPPDTMLRIGMSNPPYIKKHIDAICDILLHENVFEFLHIPVQSCSNAVLAKMNREYEVEEFLQLVDTIRRKVPNCTIATDIITGFPTETDEDHRLTQETLQRLKLPVINISQFYPRKGTLASQMKQLGNKVGKNRSRDITSVFMSYETNSRFLGALFKVYFNQVNDQGQLIGHNKYYIKVILLPSEEVAHLDDPLKGQRTEYFNGNSGHNLNGNSGQYSNGNSNKDLNGKSNDGFNGHDPEGSVNGSLVNGVSKAKGKQKTADPAYADMVKRLFGTAQRVRIVHTTKWHLEGVIA